MKSFNIAFRGLWQVSGTAHLNSWHTQAAAFNWLVPRPHPAAPKHLLPQLGSAIVLSFLCLPSHYRIKVEIHSIRQQGMASHPAVGWFIHIPFHFPSICHQILHTSILQCCRVRSRKYGLDSEGGRKKYKKNACKWLECSQTSINPSGLNTKQQANLLTDCSTAAASKEHCPLQMAWVWSGKLPRQQPQTSRCSSVFWASAFPSHASWLNSLDGPLVLQVRLPSATPLPPVHLWGSSSPNRRLFWY